MNKTNVRVLVFVLHPDARESRSAQILLPSLGEMGVSKGFTLRREVKIKFMI
ncbi:MAG: hypothetical protein M3Q76_03215 [Acidobacteriota bacterium]|nr:hypothetical protein [Acidobacteriota bacterium]